MLKAMQERIKPLLLGYPKADSMFGFYVFVFVFSSFCPYVSWDVINVLVCKRAKEDGGEWTEK